MLVSLTYILLKEQDLNVSKVGKLWTILLLGKSYMNSTSEANDIAYIPARAENNLTSFIEELTQTLRH